MQRYVVSFAESTIHQPEHPERTARRNFGAWDVMFQVWPNRAAMLKTLELQGRRASRRDDWRPVQKWTCGQCGTNHTLSGVLIVNCPSETTD